MTGTPRLAAAVDGLTRAFGPRRDRIQVVDACGHCFEPEQLRALSGPVDDIPEQLFSRALYKWGTTMDSDVPLWRRLTPRILGLLAAGELHIDEMLMARKFGEAVWQEWPEAEHAAVAEFCAAWFDAALTDPDGPVPATVLPFVAGMFGDLPRWLEVWSRTPGPQADREFADLLRWWLPDLVSGRFRIDFDGEMPDAAAQVAAWFIAEAPSRLREGDLTEDESYMLAQLALPEDERWR